MACRRPHGPIKLATRAARSVAGALPPARGATGLSPLLLWRIPEAGQAPRTRIGAHACRLCSDDGGSVEEAGDFFVVLPAAWTLCLVHALGPRGTGRALSETDAGRRGRHLGSCLGGRGRCVMDRSARPLTGGDESKMGPLFGRCSGRNMLERPARKLVVDNIRLHGPNTIPCETPRGKISTGKRSVRMPLC